MSLVSISDLLKKAEKGGYAGVDFNCNNMDLVQAIRVDAVAGKSHAQPRQ